MNYTTILSIFLFYFSSSFIYAQHEGCHEVQSQLQKLGKQARKLEPEIAQKKLDSLTVLIEDGCILSKAESKIVSGRIAIRGGELDAALNHFDVALELSKDNVNNRKRITNYVTDVYSRREQNKKGLEISERALRIPCPEDSISCHRLDGVLYTDCAVFLKKLDRVEEALTCYHKIEELYEQHEIVDSMVQGSIYNSIGNIYEGEFGNFRQSLNYYKKALDILPNGNMGKFLVQNNMGFRYKSLGKIDSSSLFFNKTINGTSNSRYLITAYQGLGAIASSAKDYPNGIKYYGLALESAIKSKRSRSMYKSRVFLTKTHYLNGDFELAQKYLLEAAASRKDAEESSQYQAERNMYSHLIDVALVDKKLSYGLYQDFLNYDTIALNQRTKIVDKSTSKYEKRILKDSLDRVVLLQSVEEQKVSNYRLSTGLLIMSLLFLAGLAFQFRKLFSKQKEVNEELVFQNNELQILNEQLEQRTKALSEKPKAEGKETEVSLKTKDKVYFIPSSNISYVQAEDDGVRVYYDGTSKWTDVSLKNFHQELEDRSFVQIAKGVVVNVNNIAWINTNTLKMKAGAELKIGRVYKPKIKAALES